MGLSDRLLAGRLLDVVEDLPGGGLDLILGVGGDLGEHVAGAMDEPALAQAAVKDPLGRADEPLGAVGDDQQRRPQHGG